MTNLTNINAAVSVIESCETNHQIKSCNNWIWDVSNRGLFQEVERKYLFERIYKKWRQINGSKIDYTLE